MARDGFVMGEGAGVLVIEELSHALARGAKPLAELVGYGTTADAHHVTSGPEDGDGARRAMEIAIAQAGISAREVRHLNAHATSTPVGDLGEIEAIKSVFGRIRDRCQRNEIGDRTSAGCRRRAWSHLLDPGAQGPGSPADFQFESPDPAADGVDFVADAARPIGAGLCDLQWLRLRRRQRQRAVPTLDGRVGRRERRKRIRIPLTSRTLRMSNSTLH